MFTRRTIASFCTIALALQSLVSLTACTSSTTAASSALPSASPETSNKTSTGAVGEKWINSDIIGNVTSDMTIDLKDDFAAAVNQEWLTTTSLPSGYSQYGALKEANDLLRERKLSLINDDTLTSHDAELVKTLYALTENWTARNQAGTESAKPYFDAITSISTLDDLSSFLSDDSMNPFGLYLSSILTYASYNDATKYIVWINEPEYFLSYSDDYTNMSDTGQMYYDEAQQQTAYVLQRLGWSEKDANAVFDGAIKFETMLAKTLYTMDESNSSEINSMINNEMTLDAINDIQGSFPLTEIITGAGYGESESFDLENPRFVKSMSDIYTEDNLELIKDYLLAHTATSLITYLDQEAYDKHNSIQNSVYGSTGSVSDEEYCDNTVNTLLSWPLDNLYVDEYCSEEKQATILEMADEIRSYYRTMIESEDWLSDSTKAAAIEKLDNMKIHAIIPEVRYDYSELTLKSSDEGGTLTDALIAIKLFERERDKSHIGKNVSSDEWEMTTSTVNAYYQPTTNSMYMLDGILIDPVITDENNYAEMLSAAGSILGHEMSHAFDSNGALFDANGNLVNWWTDEDKAAFDAKTQSVVDYLNQITPITGRSDLHCNGDLNNTEFTADLVSFQPLFAIAKTKENFDWDTFFKSHAVIWRRICTKEIEISQLQGNVHPLAYLRVNAILQQYQEFYDFYDIQPGDDMYLAPEDRVSVW